MSVLEACKSGNLEDVKSLLEEKWKLLKEQFL
jgi:hypothetical protein